MSPSCRTRSTDGIDREGSRRLLLLLIYSRAFLPSSEEEPNPREATVARAAAAGKSGARSARQPDRSAPRPRRQCPRVGGLSAAAAVGNPGGGPLHGPTSRSPPPPLLSVTHTQHARAHTHRFPLASTCTQVDDASGVRAHAKLLLPVAFAPGEPSPVTSRTRSPRRMGRVVGESRDFSPGTPFQPREDLARLTFEIRFCCVVFWL